MEFSLAWTIKFAASFSHDEYSGLAYGITSSIQFLTTVLAIFTIIDIGFINFDYSSKEFP